MRVYSNEKVDANPRTNMKMKSIKKRIKKLKDKLKKIKNRIKQIEIVPVLFDILTVSFNKEVVCLGTEYGGWRIIPELIASDDKVLSVGVGEDMSFDFTMVEKFGVKVLLMDPTPRAVKHYNETVALIRGEKVAPINNSDIFYNSDKGTLDHLSYLEYGLWNKDCSLKFYTPKQKEHVSHSVGNLQNTQEYFEAECKTLNSLDKSGFLEQCNVLKLDIEGAEFPVIRDLVRLRGFRPNQLLIEFHPGESDLEKKYRLKTLLHSLLLRMIGYRIVSCHGWDYQFVHSSCLK